MEPIQPPPRRRLTLTLFRELPFLAALVGVFALVCAGVAIRPFSWRAGSDSAPPAEPSSFGFLPLELPQPSDSSLTITDKLSFGTLLKILNEGAAGGAFRPFFSDFMANQSLRAAIDAYRDSKNAAALQEVLRHSTDFTGLMSKYGQSEPFAYRTALIENETAKKSANSNAAGSHFSGSAGTSFGRGTDFSDPQVGSGQAHTDGSSATPGYQQAGEAARVGASPATIQNQGSPTPSSAGARYGSEPQPGDSAFISIGNSAPAANGTASSNAPGAAPIVDPSQIQGGGYAAGGGAGINTGAGPQGWNDPNGLKQGGSNDAPPGLAGGSGGGWGGIGPNGGANNNGNPINSNAAVNNGQGAIDAGNGGSSSNSGSSSVNNGSSNSNSICNLDSAECGIDVNNEPPPPPTHLPAPPPPPTTDTPSPPPVVNVPPPPPRR